MKSPILYVGLLLVFVMTVALVGPLFIDWSNYRSDIEAYGERITGRQVKVNGDIEVRLLPAPILRVGDVRVSNPVEATSPELLVARSLEAKLSLAPLLRGKIEISSVEIDQPVIEAEALPGGGTWELSPMGGFERLLVADDVRLDDARITEGTLVVRDPSRDFVARLENLDMWFQAPSLAGPFKGRGSFVHDGNSRKFTLSTGRRRVDRPTHISMTLSPGAGAGKRYVVDGEVDRTDLAPSFKGKLRIFEAEAGTEAEGGASKADLGGSGLDQLLAFELRADVDATLDEARLDQVQFILGRGRSRATMTGRARVDIWNGPRLDAKLSARRLDLDAVVTSQQADEESRPAPSTRDILGQIPRLLEFLPKTLTGQLAMDVEGLVLGGHQIEGAGVTLRFAPGALTVSRAVGNLPGQSQLSITGTYHPDAEDTDFDGIFSLNARDAKTFITWLAPKLLPVLDPQAGGARGNLALKGELRVKKTLVELVGVEATVDKSKARLGLSVAFTERLAFGLRVLLDELNIDRYLPTPKDKVLAEETDETQVTAAEGSVNPLAILGEFDANIVVRAKRMVIRGTGMSDMAADITLRGGNLAVRELSVTDLGGAQLQVRGELNDVAGNPTGRLEGTFDAADPTEFLKLVGAEPADAGPGGSWAKWAKGWGPASLTAILDAAGGGETPKLALETSGYFAQSKVSVAGSLEGGLGDIQAARADLTIDLANEHGDELLRQLGIAAAIAPDSETRPGKLHGKVSGTLVDGLDVKIGGEAYGAEMTVAGKARQIAGVTSIEAEVKLAAADAGPLYRAMRLAGEQSAQTAGSLSLRALIAGKEGEFVITGLTGTVADVPVNVNGSVTVSDGRPELRVTANVAELSLPWALGVIVAGDGSSDPVAQAVAAVGDSGSVIPVWSPLPFRPDNLDVLSLELKAEVGKLALGEALAVNQASFEARLGDGKLSLTDLKGRLFGGALDLSGSLTAQRSRISLEAEYSLDGADLEQVSRFALDEPPVDGKASVRGNLSGSGRNTLALMSSLGGSGILTVTDARLRKFDATAFAEALREARDEEQVDNAARTVLTGGMLEIGTAEAPYTVASGLARFDPIPVKTGVVSGKVSTFVDLAAWRFDNEWQLTLDKVADAPPMAVSIAGPLGAGERTLDIRDLGIFLTMKALREDTARVEEMERRAREQIRLEQESLKRLEEEARRKREAREREARAREAARPNETTLEQQNPLDAPLVPPPSAGENDVPKQVDRIRPQGTQAKKPAPPPGTQDGVIRLGPDQRLPAARDTATVPAPEGVERQALPPPAE